MIAPPLVGIRHVALRVRDLAATERFWVDVIGFRVEWRPDDDNVYLASGADNLALHRADSVVGDGALDHVGLAVARAEDVDAWAAHLRASGVALATEPRTHRDGSRSLYFRDPAGTLVQILWHAPLLGRES